MTISFDSRVRIPEDVLVSPLNGESVLLNLKSEAYFGLDEVGTRFWKLLTTSDSIQAAYETLLGEYDVNPETLREHLAELIDGLVQSGLIQVL